MNYAVKTDMGWTGLAGDDDQDLCGLRLTCAAPKEKRILMTVKAAAFAFRDAQRKNGRTSKVVRVRA